MADLKEIFEAVKREREYQTKKWGSIQEHPHSVAEWILIIKEELKEATLAWVKEGGDRSALEELLQVVATGVACLEQHGIVERKEITNETVS